MLAEIEFTRYCPETDTELALELRVEFMNEGSDRRPRIVAHWDGETAWDGETELELDASEQELAAELVGEKRRALQAEASDYENQAVFA